MGSVHLIKQIYVPESKFAIVREFEDLCRKKRISQSDATIALIEAAMERIPKKERKEAGIKAAKLESFSVIRTKSGKSYKVKQK